MEEELTEEELGLSMETSGRKAMLVQSFLQSYPRAPEALPDLVLGGIRITIEIQSPRPQTSLLKLDLHMDQTPRRFIH